MSGKLQLLLPILEQLASFEETEIRNEAIKSLLVIG